MFHLAAYKIEHLPDYCHDYVCLNKSMKTKNKQANQSVTPGPSSSKSDFQNLFLFWKTGPWTLDCSVAKCCYLTSLRQISGMLSEHGVPLPSVSKTPMRRRRRKRRTDCQCRGCGKPGKLAQLSVQCWEKEEGGELMARLISHVWQKGRENGVWERSGVRKRRR